MSRRDRNEKAAEYFRRAPGYSAEAIEYLRFSAAKEGMDDESRETVALFRWLSDRIEEAHKVALPTDGKLFDVTPEALGRYVEANIAAGRHALSVPRYLRYYPVPEGCQSIGPSAP